MSISEKDEVQLTRMMTTAPIHIDADNKAALNVALNLKIRHTVIAACEYIRKQKLHRYRGDQRLCLADPQL